MSGGIQIISSSSSIQKETIPSSSSLDVSSLKEPYLIAASVEALRNKVVVSSSLENKKDRSQYSAFRKLARAYGEFYPRAIEILLKESVSDKEKEITELLEKFFRHKELFKKGFERIKEEIRKNKAIIDQSGDKKEFLLTLLTSAGGVLRSETETFLKNFSKDVNLVEYGGIPFLEMKVGPYNESIRLRILPQAEGTAFDLPSHGGQPIIFAVVNRDYQNYEGTKRHELHHLIESFMERAGLVKKNNPDAPNNIVFRRFREELVACLLSSSEEILEFPPEKFLYMYEYYDKEIRETLSRAIYFLNFSLFLTKQKGIPITDFFYAALRAGDFVELKKNFMEILEVEKREQDAVIDQFDKAVEILQKGDERTKKIPLEAIRKIGEKKLEPVILTMAKNSTYLHELFLLFPPEVFSVETAQKLFPFLTKELIPKLLELAKGYKFLKIPLHTSSISEFITTLFQDNWMFKEVSVSFVFSGMDEPTVLDELPDFFRKISTIFPQIGSELNQIKDKLKAMISQQPRFADIQEEKIIENQLNLIEELSSSLRASHPENTKKENPHIKGTSSSLVGGIDLTRLPIVTQAITNLGSSPLRPSSYLSLRQLNLSEEYKAIESLASSGLTPSSERLKSFLQASCLQEKIGEEKDRALGLLTEVLRDEEFSLRPTEPGLRDILVVLESSTSNQQLKEIFLGKGI